MALTIKKERGNKIVHKRVYKTKEAAFKMDIETEGRDFTSENAMVEEIAESV